MPAVSMKRKVPSCVVTAVSMASRVVPAISLTMVRGSPTMALNSDDLPALGRPTMATGISAGASLAAASPGRSAPVSSTSRSSSSAVPRPCVELTISGSPKPSWYSSWAALTAPGSSILLAASTTGTRRRRSTSAISKSSASGPARPSTTKSTTSAAVDGQLDLLADVPGVGRLLGGVVAAGVDHAHDAALPVDLDVLAVAGHARRLVHHGLTRAAQAVHEGGLAGVRRADDDDGGRATHRDSVANA